jgi:hypothetical protein
MHNARFPPIEDNKTTCGGRCYGLVDVVREEPIAFQVFFHGCFSSYLLKENDEIFWSVSFFPN